MIDTKILLVDEIRERSRILDYIELTKPELTSLSVLTALCGFYLATSGAFDVWRFIHVVIGTACLGGGAGALNQYVERKYDAMMKRTERRPLPAGRVAPGEALAFGWLLSMFGILDLLIFTNYLTAALGAITFVSYLFLYTPLKRVTPLATFVGGIPGALPPVMGWTAVRNEITVESWILFAILFCWQMPHFFSLAWMYRKDYARAGFKMLSVVDEKGTRTARQVMAYCFALIPASVVATLVGATGPAYLVGALLLGVFFLVLSLLFARSVAGPAAGGYARANTYSRRIFFASLVYLPALMLLMALDKV
jgi:protoheme IX farnesyltransferase